MRLVIINNHISPRCFQQQRNEFECEGVGLVMSPVVPPFCFLDSLRCCDWFGSCQIFPIETIPRSSGRNSTDAATRHLS